VLNKKDLILAILSSKVKDKAMFNKIFLASILVISVIRTTEVRSCEAEDIGKERKEFINSKFIRPPEDEEETYCRSLELNYNICIPYTEEKNLESLIEEGLKGSNNESFDFGDTYIFTYQIKGKAIADFYENPICKYGMYESLEKAEESMIKLKKIFINSYLSISFPTEIKNSDLQNFSNYTVYMPVNIYNEVYNDQN